MRRPWLGLLDATSLSDAVPFHATTHIRPGTLLRDRPHYFRATGLSSSVPCDSPTIPHPMRRTSPIPCDVPDLLRSMRQSLSIQPGPDRLTHPIRYGPQRQSEPLGADLFLCCPLRLAGPHPDRSRATYLRCLIPSHATIHAIARSQRQTVYFRSSYDSRRQSVSSPVRTASTNHAPQRPPLATYRPCISPLPSSATNRFLPASLHPARRTDPDLTRAPPPRLANTPPVHSTANYHSD